MKLSSEVKYIFKEIPVKEIEYSKYPRFETEDSQNEEFQDLVRSVIKNGILHPIIVKPSGNKYQIIVGNRRLRAAKEAKLSVIPAKIEVTNDINGMVTAFVENKIRKNASAMDTAKELSRIYRQAGIINAIGKVKYFHNVKPADRNTEKGNRTPESSLPTTEFMQIFNQIPLKPVYQYELLQLVEQLPTKIQNKISKSRMNINKAKLLTHSKLKEKGGKAQEYAYEVIKDKPQKIARDKIKQIETDIDTGYMEFEKNGNISYASSREKPPEIFDVEIPDLHIEMLRFIGKLIGRPLSRGEILYEPKIYKPKIEELEKKLSKIPTNQLQMFASQAAVLKQICEVIIKSVR